MRWLRLRLRLRNCIALHFVDDWLTCVLEFRNALAQEARTKNDETSASSSTAHWGPAHGGA